MTEPADIAIVGAGAAGLAAAIFAAEAAPGRPRPRILVLDGARKIGAKILISGGGRCNVTHDRITAEDFNGSRPAIRNVLAAFDERATVRWFSSLGVALKREETGKLFPISNSARTVLHALLHRCTALGVSVRADCRVLDVCPADRSPSEKTSPPSFAVRLEHGELRARQVILATGGRSLPRTGSDGGGWEIARRLGHSVTDTYPALVPLVLRPDMFHVELSGLSCPVALSTFADDKLVDRRAGDLLFTHFGVSGPVVMDASRHWVIAHGRAARASLRCSFLPTRSFEHIDRELLAAASTRGGASLARVLTAWLPQRLAAALAHSSGLDPSSRIGELGRRPRRVLAHSLTGLPLPVTRDRGWNFAEVTAGGVPLSEIDYRNMASRKAKGLFLAGEMLDCDGRIGGFNFQWAWATGYLAGRGAVAALAPAPRG